MARNLPISCPWERLQRQLTFSSHSGTRAHEAGVEASRTRPSVRPCCRVVWGKLFPAVSSDLELLKRGGVHTPGLLWLDKVPQSSWREGRGRQRASECEAGLILFSFHIYNGTLTKAARLSLTPQDLFVYSWEVGPLTPSLVSPF